MVTQLRHAVSPRDLPARRVVLLGASNLTKAFATVVEAAQTAWGHPLDILSADGHGRSYGQPTFVFYRTLSGIIDCGLWKALDQRPPAPTAALVTDIGNDLLYEVPIDRIIDWVETCLQRLEAIGARIVVTGLPLDSVSRVPSWRFRILRRMFFPFNRLPQATLIEQAAELNRRLVALQGQDRFTLVTPSAHWYGFDPIHLRLVAWRAAWQTILLPWSEGHLTATRPAFRATVRNRLRLWSIPPEQRSVLGIAQSRQQPSLALDDGTTLSFY